MTMKINSENQIFDPIAAIRNALAQGPKGVMDQINIAVDVLGFDAQRVYNAMRQNPDYASITHASTDVMLSYLLSYRIDEHAYTFLGYSADNSDDPRAIRRSSMLQALMIFLLLWDHQSYQLSIQGRYRHVRLFDKKAGNSASHLLTRVLSMHNQDFVALRYRLFEHQSREHLPLCLFDQLHLL